mmetsp:Transcript_6364/g.14633  ORF Transcript_6364/g.14633 Transcript_6364/m.14633 type:complete len:290 (-) Transcript_6364:1812-2681(-)
MASHLRRSLLVLMGLKEALEMNKFPERHGCRVLRATKVLGNASLQRGGTGLLDEAEQLQLVLLGLQRQTSTSAERDQLVLRNFAAAVAVQRVEELFKLFHDVVGKTSLLPHLLHVHTTARVAQEYNSVIIQSIPKQCFEDSCSRIHELLGEAQQEQHGFHICRFDCDSHSSILCDVCVRILVKNVLDADQLLLSVHSHQAKKLVEVQRTTSIPVYRLDKCLNFRKLGDKAKESQNATDLYRVNLTGVVGVKHVKALLELLDFMSHEAVGIAEDLHHFHKFIKIQHPALL